MYEIKVQIHSFACGHLVVSILFIEKTKLSTLNCLGTLVENQLTVKVRIHFWILNSTPLWEYIYSSTVRPLPYCVDCQNFITGVGIRNPPTLFLFFKLALPRVLLACASECSTLFASTFPRMHCLAVGPLSPLFFYVAIFWNFQPLYRCGMTGIGKQGAVVLQPPSRVLQEAQKPTGCCVFSQLWAPHLHVREQTGDRHDTFFLLLCSWSHWVSSRLVDWSVGRYLSASPHLPCNWGWRLSNTLRYGQHLSWLVYAPEWMINTFNNTPFTMPVTPGNQEVITSQAKLCFHLSWTWSWEPGPTLPRKSPWDGEKNLCRSCCLWRNFTE